MSVGFKKGFLKAAEQFLVFVLQNITEHILCLSIPHVPPFLLLFPPFTWCQWICMRACWAHRGMWHPPRYAAAPARSTCAWTEACNNKICAWTLQQQNMCLNTATTKHVLEHCNNKTCAWTLHQQNMCLNTATTKNVLEHCNNKTCSSTEACNNKTNVKTTVISGEDIRTLSWVHAVYTWKLQKLCTCLFVYQPPVFLSAT